jgi:hypothetical protein
MNVSFLTRDKAGDQKMSTDLWITLSVVGVLGTIAAIAIWRMSNSAEREIRSALEKDVSRDVAKWLAQRTGQSQQAAFQNLQASQVAQGFADAYNEHVDFVFMDFDRNSSQYSFRVRIEKDGELVSTSERAVRMDDLPDPVQEKFLLGEEHVSISWHPEFENRASA